MKDRRRGLAAAILALGLAGSAAAAPAVITQPDWLTMPNGEDMANAYPRLAAQLGLSGRVILSCGVATTGKLQDCSTWDEAPAGLGFDKAVLSLAASFRMRPQTRDGQPVTGGTVRIPVKFVLPLALTLTPSPPPALPTSPRALELAHQLLAINPPTDQAARRLSALATGLENFGQPGVSSDATASIAKALRASYPPLLREAADRQARLYAAAFGDAQLEAFVAFFRSPAGEALNRATQPTQAEQAAIARRAQPLVIAATQAAFCAKHTCLSADVGAIGAPQGAARASADSAEAVDIASPQWVDIPSHDQVIQARPDLAKVMRLPGAVRLACIVAQQGVLGPCRIRSETPRGLGFGQAARTLAPYYRLSLYAPQDTAAGKAVAVDIHFEAEDPGPPEPDASAPPRSLASLALARTLIATLNAAPPSYTAFQRQRTANQPLGPGISHADLDAVYDAMDQGAAEVKGQIADLQAARLSVALTDVQMTEIVRFWRSPPGAAWVAKVGGLSRDVQQIGLEATQQIWTETARAFCAGRDCLPAIPQDFKGQGSAPSTLKP